VIFHISECQNCHFWFLDYSPQVPDVSDSTNFALFFFFWYWNPTWVLVLCTRSVQAFLSLMSWLQFLSFSFWKSFITLSLHLIFGHALVLTSTGFQSVIYSTSFISSILLRCPHNLILCAFMYLTISSPCINFCSLLLLILHPSLHWTGPDIFLICFSKTNKLFKTHTDCQSFAYVGHYQPYQCHVMFLLL